MVGHVERMDEYHMTRMVLMSEITGGRVRGRPRLGWMDDVKVALGNRIRMVEAAQHCVKDRKEWTAVVHMELNECHAAIFAWPVFFRTALSCYGCYHPQRGGMPLHDAVGKNYNKGVYTENQGTGAKYMG